MKKVIKNLQIVAFLLLTVVIGCTDKKGNVMNNQPPKYYPTANEAVAQGKNDLLDILKSYKDLNIGVSASDVDKARPESAVQLVEVDFQKLIQKDSVRSFNDLAIGSRGLATPISIDSQVVAIINTTQDKNGWRVSGLGDKLMKDDINLMRRGLPNFNQSEVKFFDIPNINARVYVVLVDGKEAYFTNYEGFSFAKPANASEIIAKIRQDAVNFNNLYGKEIKKRKLVK